MKYTNNAIFTKMRQIVLTERPDVHCTQTYAPTPTKWPTVFAREIGRYTPGRTQTFRNTQDISERTWEVQIFSNLQTGAKEEAYALLDLVKSAFREMYFLEYSETPVDSANNTYYILVARFRRIIGSGEEMN